MIFITGKSGGRARFAFGATVASTEPVIFITGKERRLIVAGLRQRASTEPVIFITGKSARSSGRPGSGRAFNGAGDLHHRKGS